VTENNAENGLTIRFYIYLNYRRGRTAIRLRYTASKAR